MIIDNADEIDVLFKPVDERTENSSTFVPGLGSRSLSDYVPQSMHGSVVITSRSRDVAHGLAGRTRGILDVAPMDPDTSVVLLRKKLEGDTRDEDLISLVQSLDGMPLAISQAASAGATAGVDEPVRPRADPRISALRVQGGERCGRGL